MTKKNHSGATLCRINEVTAGLKTARMSAQATCQANSMALNAKLGAVAECAASQPGPEDAK